MDKNYTKQEYTKYVSEKSPKSSLLKDCLMAFLVGGLICTIGQVLLEIYTNMGLDKKASASMVSVTMIFIGALLTGLGLYSKIGKYAGAGSIVPITGFANSIVSPAMEFKTEGLILGLAAKMFTIAGPVIVYGTITSVIIGLVKFLFG